MSVYIKGMEMPTTGLYLVSVDNSCGKDETIMTVRRMLGNRDVCQIIGAYNLVPVPPHGRLIDAHELEADGWRLQRYLLSNGGCCVEGMAITRATTIIPADKESEE